LQIIIIIIIITVRLAPLQCVAMLAANKLQIYLTFISCLTAVSYFTLLNLHNDDDDDDDDDDS